MKEDVRKETQNFLRSSSDGMSVKSRMDPSLKCFGVVIKSKTHKSNDETPFYR